MWNSKDKPLQHNRAPEMNKSSEPKNKMANTYSPGNRAKKWDGDESAKVATKAMPTGKGKAPSDPLLETPMKVKWSKDQA